MGEGKIKNICIFGTGGIGGVFGGRIANNISILKDNCHKVYYIARGRHLQMINSKGLILDIPGKASLVCRPEGAYESMSDIPAPDLIFLCVKGYDLDSALSDISKNIKPDTIIIPLLNGVDIYERIRKSIKQCIVLPSCVYVGAHIAEPGRVSQDSETARIITGKDPLYPDYDFSKLKEFISLMGIDCTFLEDSSIAIWEKYLFIASFGLVTAYSGKSFGQVMEEPDLKELIRGVVKEILQIAVKKGVKLPENIEEKTISKGNDFPYNSRTSYQRDVESKKGKNEGELFGGAILKLGQETAVDTPVTKMVYYNILSR